MALQGFLHRTCSFMNSRFLLSSRLPQINQTSGVKQKVIDHLKDLKIPDKPKRPLTPYFRFFQEHRDSIVKKYPNWKITQVAVQCASDWKQLDPATKKKYEDDYRDAMEKYSEKYAHYIENLTEDQKDALDEYKNELKASKVRRERKKKVRDNDKPKRPMGAYLLYVQDQAKANPKKSYVQLLSDLKGKWSSLPAGEKAPYAALAAKAKEQFEIDLKQWELKMIQEGNEDLVRQSTLIGKPPKSKKE